MHQETGLLDFILCIENYLNHPDSPEDIELYTSLGPPLRTKRSEMDEDYGIPVLKHI